MLFIDPMIRPLRNFEGGPVDARQGGRIIAAGMCKTRTRHRLRQSAAAQMHQSKRPRGELGRRVTIEFGSELTYWGVRHSGQLPVDEVAGWSLDVDAKAEIDRI